MNKEVSWLLREKYNGKATADFYKDTKKLEQGELLDYVIGFTEFLGCKINLSKKPLIPRSETEFWVKAVIEEIKKEKGKKRALDIFSGSGCIGVALLKNVPELLCDIAEKDRELLKQIRINLKINKIKANRYKVIQSDVFKNIKGKYDFILSNPPYIAKTRKNKIQRSVLKYEPHKALFGGEDGLFYIKKFLNGAREHLNDGGKIYMEFDYVQKKEIGKLIKRYGYSNHEFYKDQYGKWRWVSAF
jgi:release factor glutamine methyltransferase